MANVIRCVLDAFKLRQVKAEEETNGQNGQVRRQSGTWPRRLSFTPFPRSCTEEEPSEPFSQPGSQSSVTSSAAYDTQEDVSLEDQCAPSFFMRKLSCVFQAGKVGLTEGSLTGAFFGGGWGMYKYLCHQAIMFLGEDGKEGEDGSKGSVAEGRGSRTSGTGSSASGPRSTSASTNSATNRSSDSTVNENIIFAQNKQESQPKRRWLLSTTEDLEPATDSEEPSFPTVVPEHDTFRNRASCLYEAAKHGTQEGVLTGVFFGGSWGIFKSISLSSFLTPPPAEEHENKTPTKNLSFLDPPQHPPPSNSETLSWIESSIKSAHIREEGGSDPVGSQSSSRPSEATLPPQTYRNPEFIGYAIVQTGSFDDSDGRHSDDPEQSTSTADRGQKKRKTSENSDERNRRPSRDSKTGTLKSNSQKPKSAKASQDLIPHLRKRVSAKSGASSSAGQSLAAIRDIMEISNPSKHLQDPGTSSRGSKAAIKTPETPSDSSGKVSRRAKTESFASDDSGLAPDATQITKLTFQSDQSFVIQEYSDNELSNSKVTEPAGAPESYQALTQSTGSTVSNRKSGDIQATVETPLSKRRMSSRGATKNIFPGRDISKSILRNADSISNGYYSLTMNNTNDGSSLALQGSKAGMGNNASQISQRESDISQQDKSEHPVPQPETSEWFLPPANPDTSDGAVSMSPIKVASMATYTPSGTKTSFPSMSTSHEGFSSTIHKPERVPSGPLQDYLPRTGENLFRSNSGLGVRESYSKQMIMSANARATLDNSLVSAMTVLEDATADSGINQVSQSAYDSPVPQFPGPDQMGNATASVTNQAGSQSSGIALAHSESSTTDQGQMSSRTPTHSQNPSSVFSGANTATQPPSEDTTSAGRSCTKNADSDQSTYRVASSRALGSKLEKLNRRESETSGEARYGKESRQASATAAVESTKGSLESSRESLGAFRGVATTSYMQSSRGSTPLKNSPEINKSTSSFIQKMSRLSDISSRTYSVEKPTNEPSQAQGTLDEKDEGTAAKKFNFLSAINENIIVLSACNCALVLGLVCGVISTTKATLKF